MTKHCSQVKSALYAAGIAAAFVFTAADEAPALTYMIDASHSAVIFGVQHMHAGYTYGRFNQLEGMFVYDEEKPENNSIELRIRTGTVDTANADRDKHLMSKDFFDAEKQPLITFTSKQIKPVEGKPGMFLATGEVKMLGKSKTMDIEVKFTGKATDPFRNIRAGGVAKFTLKRSDFGLDMGLDNVGDEVDVIVSIEGAEAKQG